MHKKPFVESQKVTEKKGNPESYQSYVNRSAKVRPDETEFKEHDRANPDNLSEEERMYSNSQPSYAQQLMGEAVEHLQGRQKQVYQLTMREGLSIAKAAGVLGITKSTAQVYREKAIKFITQYCRQVINNDR